MSKGFEAVLDRLEATYETLAKVRGERDQFQRQLAAEVQRRITADGMIADAARQLNVKTEEVQTLRAQINAAKQVEIVSG